MADSILRVGLTGGIGSGKTAASDYLNSLGVPIIDTDILAREIVEPGRPALKDISSVFGDDVIHSNGYLDREKLRRIVFSDTKSRLLLEDILHPLIRDSVERQIATFDYPYSIIVIPLLLESRYPIPTDRVLVIDTDPSMQRKRIKQRDHIDDKQLESIMSAQTERSSRLAIADDVLINNGDLISFHAKLDRLHQSYLDDCL